MRYIRDEVELDKEPRRMVDLGLGIGADRSPGPMKAQEMSMDDGD